MGNNYNSFIRSFLWLGFFTTVLLSWLYLYFMSISMGLDLFGKKDSDIIMGSMITFKMLLPMWSVMMIAMMLPTAIPVIIMFDKISNERKKLNYKFVPTLNFTLSYLIIWSFFWRTVIYFCWNLSNDFPKRILSSLLQKSNRNIRR